MNAIERAARIVRRFTAQLELLASPVEGLPTAARRRPTRKSTQHQPKGRHGQQVEVQRGEVGDEVGARRRARKQPRADAAAVRRAPVAKGDSALPRGGLGVGRRGRAASEAVAEGDEAPRRFRFADAAVSDSDVRREMRAVAQVFAESVGDLPSSVAEKLEQLRWPAGIFRGARSPEGLPPPHERAYEVRRTADGMVLAEGASVADAADKALFLWRAR